MKIAGHVEPRLVVVVLDLDHQRVAFPVAARIAHPEIDPLWSAASVRVDQAENL